MIGARARSLHTGDIRQVGDVRRRREARDEVGKIIAIDHEQGRARGIFGHEDMRHGGEEFLANHPLGCRKTRLHRADEPAHHIVAVDAEAPLGPLTGVCRQPGRKRTAGVEKRLGKVLLCGCEH
jgi:hypothetical protein